MSRHSGFTLIEISIVLVIIGLILGAVMLSGTGTIDNTKTTSTISLIKDLSAAVADFKSRYHYLPGDLPKASDDIPNLPMQCNIDVSITNIGNGLIDTSDERDCVSVELVQAGFIKGGASGILSPWNAGTTPDVHVLAAKFSSVNTNGTPFPSNVLNVIEINDIPCDAVTTIDSKMDDGDTSQGKMRSYPPCVDEGGGIPASTTLDVAL